MIAIPAAVPVNLNSQPSADRRANRLQPPPRTPKRSVAAARSWGDAMRSCRPAPEVTFMPTQRALVAALQSTVSDVALGRTRQRVDGVSTPTSSRPGTAEAARAARKPRLRPDAQWKLDGASPYGSPYGGGGGSERSVSTARSARERPPQRLHALQAVPGAGVVGGEDAAAAATGPAGRRGSGAGAAVHPDAAVRQLMESSADGGMLEHVLAAPMSPAPKGSPKAGTLRGTLDLGGAQHPRSPTSSGAAESRRSTVRHMDDILNHPSRTPRKPNDRRGLLPDDDSEPRLEPMSSAQALGAARLRREGVYVTGVVQPVMPPSVFCRDQHRSSGVVGAPVASRSTTSMPRLPVPKAKRQERVAIGPFEDGTYATVRPWTATRVDLASPSQDVALPDEQSASKLALGPSGWAPMRIATPPAGSRPLSRGHSPGGARPYRHRADEAADAQPKRGVVPPRVPSPTLPEA